MFVDIVVEILVLQNSDALGVEGVDQVESIPETLLEAEYFILSAEGNFVVDLRRVKITSEYGVPLVVRPKIPRKQASCSLGVVIIRLLKMWSRSHPWCTAHPDLGYPLSFS